MKKIVAILLVLSTIFALTSCVTTATATTYTDLYTKDSIMDIKIQISDEDFQSILDNPTAEEYKTANVSVNGVTVDNVGFRAKGNLSLNSVAKSDSDRYSFRIKFDKYVEDQTLLGLDELVVNNMFSDPSYMREYLSYEALSDIGSNSPLTSYANIYINGELYGFYLCVEAIDNSYLERTFGDDSGNLYKQEQGSSLVYQEGSEYKSSELKSGDDESKTGLKNFIKVLNEMPDGQKGDIESVLDVDSALKYIAANTVLCNYDSYNGNMLQNYYLYELNGKFTVIPWDYNMSFGGFNGSSSTSQTIPIDQPVLGVSMDKTPMITNLLEVPEYKEKYYDYIKQLAAYLENFETRVDQLADIIRPYVEADPSKFVTMEQFENNIIYNETTQNQQDGMTPLGGQQTDATSGATPQAGKDQMVPPNNQQPDAVSGATPQTDVNQRPQRGQGMEPPEGMEFPQGGNRNNGPQVGGGGMMSGNNTSIVTVAVNRLENIKKQLSGELPTTGNTTMNNTGRGGFADQQDRNNSSQSKNISVKLNGKTLTFDQQPIVENDRTLVPLRGIFEALGATVEYDETTKTATAIKDDVTIRLTENQLIASVNGQDYTLDVPAKTYNGRFLVPVRFISENLKLNVTWDSETNTVNIQN